MKKVLKLILKVVSALAIAYVVFMTWLAIYYTSWENGKADSINICYSKLTKECVAAYIEWDGDAENTTFTVPDEYEGMKVNSLGGLVGMGTPEQFFVMLPEDMYSGTETCVGMEELAGEADENTVAYNFTVKLGKNIKNFEYFVYKDYYMDDRDKVICTVNIEYEVSPDNKWVYSQDGKIYSKKTNELIE